MFAISGREGGGGKKVTTVLFVSENVDNVRQPLNILNERVPRDKICLGNIINNLPCMYHIFWTFSL